jgi:Heterokaryon incompatibility protein (HET)
MALLHSHTFGAHSKLTKLYNLKDSSTRDNLWSAPQPFSRGSTGILWTDASGTNQDDAEEKSQLGQLMRTIYEKTERVWASLIAEDNIASFEILKNMHGPVADDLRWYQHPSIDFCEEGLKRPGLFSTKHLVRISYGKKIDRPYFRSI